MTFETLAVHQGNILYVQSNDENIIHVPLLIIFFILHTCLVTVYCEMVRRNKQLVTLGN